MPGQCYSCGTEFSFFKKEYGCKNCGFAFCSKCLTKKANIAKEKLKDGKESLQPVCNKCFDTLTGKITDNSQDKYTPPEAYLRRVAALEQKSQGTQPQGGVKVKMNPKYAGLDKPDQEIAMRLERLKEKPQVPKTSEKDLNDRLARLKGEDPASRTVSKPFYQPPDTRPQVQQIDDLLEEIANEVEIDSHQPTPAAYVEGRLAKLREDKSAEKRTKAEEEQNNLDKNNFSKQKNFSKNINVAEGKVKNDSSCPDSREAAGKDEVDVEEVHALMAKAAAQMEVEAQRALEGMKKDKELMERLAQVKQRHKANDVIGHSVSHSVHSNTDNTLVGDSESEDEDVAAKRLIMQFLKEAKLDKESGLNQDKEKAKKSKIVNTKPAASKQAGKSERESAVDDDYEDPDELPFCTICTEDAVIRCIDCDMDLYCDRCFKDGHKQLGLTDHRSALYKAPKGYRTG